ncbi:MAG: hypothetical protein ACJARD_000060 [Alphaproteobacteria bacterium]|jgi:hypothetical protein
MDVLGNIAQQKTPEEMQEEQTATLASGSGEGQQSWGDMAKDIYETG